MNHIYRSIWNQATGAYAAVSENVKSAGKRSLPGSSGGGASFALTSMAAAMMLGYGSLALAGPTGGTVVAGQARINGTPGATIINQGSQNAVINWQQFNIGKGESVQFVQPNSNAVALNRVLGNDGTTILGNLSANGKVFIVNPNGILFGQGSSVNTAGLVASTRDISTADFMAGNYKFSGASTGKVLNQGDLNAPGGYVALLGAHVSNEGTINARLGTVALAAGNAITLDVAGDGLLNVAVDGGAVGALVQNGGLIQADGGAVVLTAQAAGNLLKTVVNNTGVIEAHTIDTRGGTIKLLGDMQSGTVNAAGTLDASAPDGGNGGFVETSAAHVKIDDVLKVSTAAVAGHGLTGTWLIDPTNFTIAATGGDQTGAFYTNALKTSNVQIQTVATGAGAGDINVNDNIVWNANKLTLTAHNNININRALRGSGTASLALEYGQSNVASGNTSTYNVKAEVDLPSGQNFSTRLGSDGTAKVYTVINSLGAVGSTTGTDLQGLNLTGSYVLGSNIDASATSGWNSGNGFLPIGSSATPFTGTFDGLGHEIHGLTINRADVPVGLFYGIGAGGLVRNLGLINVAITGSQSVYGANYSGIGALAGANSGLVDNVYSTGAVQGSGYANVGGLVGTNNGTITNSRSGGSVTAPQYASVGGLVGVNSSGAIISRSSSAATVNASYGSAGGLVTDNRGTISDSYATGSVSAGSNYGGGLAAYNSGTINRSYATGNVNGTVGVGGLVGAINPGGSVTNSYATGNITGSNNLGGLVALSYGAIDNSYATGNINGSSTVGGVVGYNVTTTSTLTNVYYSGKLTAGGGSVGALVGDNNGGKIINGYFDKTLNNIAAVGLTHNGGTSNGLGLTSAQMLVPANYAGFNFTTTAGATGNNWVQVSSGSALNGGDGTRPMLASEWSNTINSAHQLQLMAMSKNASYTLGSSFSAAATAGTKDVWGSAGFIPVGSIMSGSFSGSFDGTGHIISGLNIAATQDYAGLFGIISVAGSVSNVGLTGATVTGASNLGMLAGHNAGKISGSFATGTVSGTGTVGGLVGTNPGAVSNSYASGTVSGATAGGLVGNSNGSIANSYANAGVSASGTGGGLLAVNSGTVTGSFWDTTASGRATSAGGGNGLTTAQLKTLSNYTGANWELNQMWVVYDGQSAPFLRSFMQPIAVRVSYDTKVYDGTAYAGGASSNSLSNVVAGGVLPGTPVYTGSAAGAINAGTYAVSVSGYYATGGQSAYAISYIDGGLVVTPRPVSLVGATAGNKVYDGTTVAALSGGTLSGMVAGDNVTVGALAGVYASKNVGNNIAVTATATLSGTAAGNYTLAPLTGVTGNITPAAISSIGGLVVGSKVYDGAATAAINAGSAVFNGKIGSDVLTVGGGTAAFSDKNVGVGKTISISGLSLGGADAANYTLQTTTGSGVGDITAKALTLTGVSASNRVYDGTTNIAITGGTLSGFVGSESVSLAGLSGTVASKNAGTAKAVTIAGSSLVDGANGGLASNYTVATPSGLTVNINQATISSVTNVVADTKTYDGGTSVTFGSATATFNGMISGDNLAIGATKASFSDKNAGTGKTVSITDLTLAGADAGNYTLASSTATGTGTITPKALTISGMSVINKVYDGTTKATLAGGSVVGLVGSENIGVTGLSATFDDKNAGTGKTATATGASLVDGVNGGLAANYTISNPTGLLANITPKALTVTGVTATTRAYDGTLAATLSGGSLSGLVNGETLTVSGGTGAYADKNAGTGKAVTVTGIGIADGTGLASNYTVSNPTGVTGTITQKALTVTGALAADKTYDGALTAAITGGTLSGLVGSETVNLGSLTGAFADKNAGSGKAVSVTGGTLSNGANGGLASNYSVTPVTGLTASIAQKALTVTGVVAADKVYDATTQATVIGGALSGLVGGETLGLSGLSGTFTNKNAGTAKAVTISGATLTDGTGLASNYTVNNPTGLTANISQATISAVTNIVADSKVYDGGTSVTFATAGATFNGMLNGDSLAIGATKASFGDKNAGAGKTVSIFDMTLAGTDAGNYVLASTTATGTGTITPKTLTITGLTGVDKTYDGTTIASFAGGAFSGLVGSETVFLNNLTTSFADANAGTGKTVTVTPGTLRNGTGGGLAANYTVNAPASLTANITPKALTVTGITAVTRAYDGTTAATLSGGVLSGLVGNETLSLSGGSGAFTDKNAGRDKAVTVSDVQIADGTGLASNYTVANPTGVTGTITQKALTVTGLTAADKTYDGTTKASVTGGTLNGLAGAETLSLSGVNGVFADQNAGSAKVVLVSVGALADGSNGGLAANYTVSNPTGLTASITPKALTVTGLTAGSKVYDGTLGAVLTGGALSGLIGTETLVLSTGTGTFADKNAGSNKVVNVSGAGIADGTGLAANYTVADPTNVTGSITQKALTVTGSVAANKTYDGTRAATVTGGAIDGLVGNETLELTGLTGTFDNQNAGTGKAVTVAGGVLADGANGGLASNYALAAVAGTTASIAQKTLTVTGTTAANKVYDGTTGAVVSGGTLAGLIGAETLNLSALSGAFVDKNAGTGKVVIVSGAALADGANGGLAANYTVTAPTGLTANIAQAALTVRVDDAVKDQGAANPAFSASYTGLVGGDTVAGEVTGNLVFSTPATTTSAAGTYAVSASGQSSANYALTYAPGTLTVQSVAPTAAVQNVVANVLGTINVAPSQGNMVQADMVATAEPVTSKASAQDTVATGEPASATAPAVQVGPAVNTNVLPGLRLSVIDTGLRLPGGGGDAVSVENQ